MRVAVYWNVRKRKFSVKALEGPDKGRVVRHLDFLSLSNVSFRVSAAGRAKVRETGVKNVHAYVVGTLGSSGDCWQTARGVNFAPVRYNPKRDEGFVRLDGTIIRSARCAELEGRGRPTIKVIEEN